MFGEQLNITEKKRRQQDTRRDPVNNTGKLQDTEFKQVYSKCNKQMSIAQAALKAILYNLHTNYIYKESFQERHSMMTRSMVIVGVQHDYFVCKHQILCIHACIFYNKVMTSAKVEWPVHEL